MISFCYLLLITLNGIHTLFSISDFEQTLRKMSKFQRFGRFSRNAAETAAFPEISYTRNLGEITVFYAVIMMLPGPLALYRLVAILKVFLIK